MDKPDKKTLLVLILFFSSFLFVQAQERRGDASAPFSLRANLLRWVTLTPDIGVEWRFATHWSAVANGTWTSLGQNSDTRRYALWEVAPEVRYYFSNFYLGAMYKQGSFNYKLSDTGKQGDIIGGGLTFGYVLPLGKVFSLDFKIGAGYLNTNYEIYNIIDKIRVKESNHNKSVWGPTDLGVTLVWHIK